jgi:hypothetical protein
MGHRNGQDVANHRYNFASIRNRTANVQILEHFCPGRYMDRAISAYCITVALIRKHFVVSFKKKYIFGYLTS